MRHEVIIFGWFSPLSNTVNVDVNAINCRDHGRALTTYTLQARPVPRHGRGSARGLVTRRRVPSTSTVTVSDFALAPRCSHSTPPASMHRMWKNPKIRVSMAIWMGTSASCTAAPCMHDVWDSAARPGSLTRRKHITHYDQTAGPRAHRGDPRKQNNYNHQGVVQRLPGTWW